jgi:hypothetical protein
VAELTTLLAKKDAKIKELEVWRTLTKLPDDATIINFNVDLNADPVGR